MAITGARERKDNRAGAGPALLRFAEQEGLDGGDLVVGRAFDPGHEVGTREAGQGDALGLEPVTVAGNHQLPLVHHYQHRTNPRFVLGRC